MTVHMKSHTGTRAGLRAVRSRSRRARAHHVAQVAIFAASGSIALLADLIHNAGDAATAIPLGIAFALRSARAERWAGLAVVLAILASGCVAGYEAIARLITPTGVDHLGALAAAGAHARAEPYVSLAVVASAAVVALGGCVSAAPATPERRRSGPADALLQCSMRLYGPPNRIVMSTRGWIARAVPDGRRLDPGRA